MTNRVRADQINSLSSPMHRIAAILDACEKMIAEHLATCHAPDRAPVAPSGTPSPLPLPRRRL